MSARRDKMKQRDDAIHFSLKNWAAHINDEWQDGPREHANGASWHDQVINRQDANFPDALVYIDHDSAERVQAGMIRCMIHDMQTAMLLTKHYRDKWEIAGLKRARDKFWKWL